MTNTSSVAAAFKDAFVVIAQSIWNQASSDVLVSFGHPGSSLPNSIVGFMDVRTEQDPATFGTNRTREEVLELDVLVSVYRGGGREAEKTASDAAYTYLGLLETYARTTDTTIGGTVRECALIRTVSDGRTDPNEIAKGRTIEITATFQARARISN
jgi:hypothetical protein